MRLLFFFLGWTWFLVAGEAKTFLFVSFSMKEAALQSYYKESQVYGVDLVMRGLFKNSFQETIKKCRALNITYLIDPFLFERYRITAVPTLIHHTPQGIYRITGHIPLKEGLRRCKKASKERGIKE